MSWPQSVDPNAKRLIALLNTRQQRLALAESCTCGLAAAMLGGVPGASHVFCGSMVTYRMTSKQAWLCVPVEVIATHSAESQETTREMALRLLDACPEANWAAAVTGHLGPGAPASKDGQVFFSLIGPATDQASHEQAHVIRETEFILSETERIPRQIEAASSLIQWVLSCVDEGDDERPTTG